MILSKLQRILTNRTFRYAPISLKNSLSAWIEVLWGLAEGLPQPIRLGSAAQRDQLGQLP